MPQRRHRLRRVRVPRRLLQPAQPRAPAGAPGTAGAADGDPRASAAEPPRGLSRGQISPQTAAARASRVRAVALRGNCVPCTLAPAPAAAPDGGEHTSASSQEMSATHAPVTCATGGVFVLDRRTAWPASATSWARSTAWRSRSAPSSAAMSVSWHLCFPAARSVFGSPASSVPWPSSPLIS